MECIIYQFCIKQRDAKSSYKAIHILNVFIIHMMHFISARTVKQTLANILYLLHSRIAVLHICNVHSQCLPRGCQQDS